MARTALDYNFVTNTATLEDSQKFGLRNYLLFHSFNPNGAANQFRKEYNFMLYEICIANPDIIPNGCLIAYANDVADDKLRRMTMSKAFPNRITAQVTVECIQRATVKVRDFINEKFPEND